MDEELVDEENLQNSEENLQNSDVNMMEMIKHFSLFYVRSLMSPQLRV